MTICPVCSRSLLRHIAHQKIAWFCSYCRQEMPDLNAVNFLKNKKYLSNKIQNKLRNNQSKNSNVSLLQTPTTLILGDRLSTIDRTISESQKRLNIVNLLIDRTQAVVTYSIADLVEYLADSLTLETSNLDNIIKICCSNADSILFYICYAILCRNSLVLDRDALNSLNKAYNNIGVTTDRVIRMINLMKTYVISLVKNELFGVQDLVVKEIYLSLNAEIANYFEQIITAIDT
jgi:hypothetical protein